MITQLEQTLGIKYSEDQKAILQDSNGLSIQSTAGSGKTTVLTHLIIKRVLSGEITDTSKVLVTTYSRAGVEELTARLGTLLAKFGKENNVKCRTFHSVYLDLLRDAGFKGDIISGGERLSYIRKAYLNVKAKRIPDDVLTELDTMLSNQVNHLFSSEQIVNSMFNTLQLDLTTYTNISKEFIRLKQADNKMDYDDLQLYIYNLVVKEQNPALIDIIRMKYRYLFIDEFQDISQIQYDILKVFIDQIDAKDLVVIGDTDQCIYEWRGAKPQLFMDILCEYPLVSHNLTVNYRCGSNIVDFANKGISQNRNRVPKEMKGANQGGEIFINGVDGDLYGVSLKAVEDIKAKVESGKSLKDMCILVRNTATGTILNSLLEEHGIPTTYKNQLHLKDTLHFKQIQSLRGLLWNTPSSIKNIWLLVKYLPSSYGEILSQIAQLHKVTLRELLGHVLDNYTNYNVPNPQISIQPKLSDKLKTASQKLTPKQIYQLHKVYKSLEITDPRKRFLRLLDLYSRGRESDNALLQEQNRFLFSVVNYLKEEIRNKGSDVLKDDKPLFPEENKLEISTIHNSKGREWDIVYYVGVDNITLPNTAYLKYIDRNLGEKDLVTALDGDRRLHFVALTRAKSEVHIYYDNDFESYYLRENKGESTGTSTLNAIQGCDDD